MHRVVGGGGGWSCSGVVVASHRFQFAFFQIKSFYFPIFQIKMEPPNFHFLAILGKKGTFGTQWQSLINSRLTNLPIF